MSPDPKIAKSASSIESATPEVSGSDELLARGECLLERLSREAEAARAEARRAELQLALADARRGKPGQLQVWMARHDANYMPTEPARTAVARHLPESLSELASLEIFESNASASSAPTSQSATVTEEPSIARESPSRSSDSATSPDDSNSVQDPWSRYLPAARQRLAARATRLSAGESVQEVVARPIEALVDNRSAARSELRSGGQRLRIDKPLRESGPTQAVPATPTVADALSVARKTERPASATLGKVGTARKSLEAKNAGSKAKKLDKEALAKLAKTIEGDVDQPQLTLRQRLFRSMSGISLSIILHLLLVVALAALTIKLPAPPASLTFETSVNATSETFELSEQLDVSEPETLSESTQLPEISVDLSQDLSEINDSMSESLAQSVASPTGLAAALAASNAGGGKSNPMQTSASFFGAAASGNCFCYVIDSSSSMNGGPWEAAKGELLRSLASLKSNQRFYIIFFNKELSAIPMPGQREPASRALYADSENIEHARQWIDTIRIAKGAPPSDALEFAVNLEPDAIYLLTDGDTTTDLTGFLRKKNRISDLIEGELVKVPIHAIAFYSLVGQELMRKVAAENKGQFIYVPDPSKR